MVVCSLRIKHLGKYSSDALQLLVKNEVCLQYLPDEL